MRLFRPLILLVALALSGVDTLAGAPDPRSAFTKAIATARIFGFMEIFRNSGLPEEMLHGDVTLIIPTDTSFYALAPETYQRLLSPANRDAALAFVRAHVVRGRLTLAQLAAGTHRTLGGLELKLTPAATSAPSTAINGRRTTLTDQAGATGVFHLIDGFLALP